MKQKNKTAIGLTLGCRLNQADTALIFGRLEDAGFSIIKPKKDSAPDLIVVNSCTVTANAAQKSRQTARHFKRKFPDACLIVTGCDCDKALSDWEKEEFVDFALPNSEKKNIPEIVANWQKNKQTSSACSSSSARDCNKLSESNSPNKHNGINNRNTKSENYAQNTKKDIQNRNALVHMASHPPPKKNTEHVVFKENTIAGFPFKSRASLKVQEGCNAYCTYCIVPHVRGRERSRAFSEVIDEAKKFIERGHKEIVLTGVNISTYCDDDKRLTDIIEAITQLPGDFRVRLSSMEPHSENKKLVELIKHNHKICRFLHIPLQHGSDTILAKMGRNYTSAKFAEFANFAINSIPGLHLGTDIIVGFPGETDELFMESVNFIKKIAFANIHVFRFSPREGTPAAIFPDQVSQQIVKQRSDILGNIAKECKKQFALLQIGKDLPVLLEKETVPGTFEGWSDNYVRVTLSGDNLHIGEIINHKIISDNYLSF
jgi:threonylcarbamoyladenosine tRNA methylthiotransferase MtaB